ncbi:hypothetical protein D3C73_883280 [compost metagenome]
MNWLEAAEEGAKLEMVPKGKDFRNLIDKGIQFAFQLSEKSTDHFEIRFLKVKSSPIKIMMNDHCRLVKKENKTMRSNTPIAVSMMNSDKKDLQVYVERYVGETYAIVRYFEMR